LPPGHCPGEAARGAARGAGAATLARLVAGPDRRAPGEDEGGGGGVDQARPAAAPDRAAARLTMAPTSAAGLRLVLAMGQCGGGAGGRWRGSGAGAVLSARATPTLAGRRLISAGEGMRWRGSGTPRG